jgi:hypothetical protein
VSDHWTLCGDRTRRVNAFTLITWERLGPEGAVMFALSDPVTSPDVPDPTFARQAMFSRSAHYAASTVAADTGCRLPTSPP